MASLISAMTSNTAPAPQVASASKEYEWAFYAFNKSFSDPGWMPNPGTLTGWLQIDLGVSKQADTYRIAPSQYSVALSRAPKSWTLNGSNNGSTWTQVDSRTNVSWPSTAYQDFTVTSPGSYRYYRLNITANNGDGTYLQVNELDLFGTPPTPTGSIAGTLGQLAGSFAATHTAPPVTGELAGTLGNLSGVFEGQDPDLPNQAQLAGALGNLTGVFAGDFQMVVASSTTYANYGYGYAGVGQVDYTPPIAPTPARVRRGKVQHIHQSLPAPTLVDGRPV